MSAPFPQPVLSSQFFQALTDAGIIRREDYITRVVIDCNMGEALRIYVDRVGDDRLLAVSRSLEGVEIERAGSP